MHNSRQRSTNADTFTGAVAAERQSAFATPLADELAARWRRGERVPAEVLLNEHPYLWNEPEQAIDLIYEEVCLRTEQGENDAAVSVLQRFPQWRAQLQIMLECHQLMEAHTPNLSVVGETLHGFRLCKLLGRGASGAVFLAQQIDLAERPIVLKITSLHEREHLSLARLQHTHIVPLYAVQDDPARKLRILCMPYLGGITLDRLLVELADRPLVERSGADMLRELVGPGVRLWSPASPILSRLPYVEALCWIAACLADALQYAWESGLVHLDVKPANILIAANGQPMLLDFHLARPPLECGERADGLGGTAHYMAPEQHAAMTALCHNAAVPQRIDQRADVFALGAVLHEALRGEAGPEQELQRSNPAVSRGLSDIISKCLANDPRDRYPDAAALAADLRCHLAARPLVGTANRSASERVSKWQRRHPIVMQSLLLIGILASLLAFIGWVLSSNERLKANLHRTELDQLAKQQRQALILHRVAEQVRGITEIDDQSVTECTSLTRDCQEFWRQREKLSNWLKCIQSASARSDLLDVFLFVFEVRNAGRSARQALQDIAEAEQLIGPSAAIDQQRARLTDTVDRSGFSECRAQNAADYVSLGRSLLRRNEVAAAAQQFQEALRLQPQDFWANFHQGQCSHRTGQYAEATAFFSVCIGMSRDDARPFFHRALAFAALGRLNMAERDYDQALHLEPTMTSAYQNRALLRLEAGRLAAAEDDLQHALHLGAAPASVCCQLARIQFTRGNLAGARQSVERVLSDSPGHAAAQTLLNKLDFAERTARHTLSPR